MPPEGRAREVALDWLRHARSNLALARQPKPPGAPGGELSPNTPNTITKYT